jgi:hypothetical protein
VVLRRVWNGSVRRSTITLLFAACALSAAPRTARAQDVDVLRGTVTSPDSQPIVGASLKFTALATQSTRTIRTDTKGQYSMVFQNGGGNYTVSVTAVGYAPQELELKRDGDEEVLRLNVVLKKAAQALAAVKIAEKKAPKTEQFASDVGGSNGQTAQNVGANSQGDLAALAATIPGFQLQFNPDGSPKGFSALGLQSAQNNVTINGLQSGATNAPRDAQTYSNISSSTFDVSRGGFSGAQTAITLGSGYSFSQHTARITFDAPSLQYADPRAASLNSQFDNLQASGSDLGELIRDKSFYNVSWQGGRRSAPLNTLLNADNTALLRLGLIPDSVARFLSIMRTLGIPLAARGVPANRENTNGSLIGRYDYNTEGGGAFNVVANGSFNKSGANSLSSRSLPTYGGESNSWTGGFQGYGSYNVGSQFLNETRLGLNLTNNSGSPFVRLPQGNVIVSSSDLSGGTNVSTLNFGSGSSLVSAARTGAVQAQDNLSWFGDDSRHRLKLTGNVRYEWYDQLEASNAFGTFSYNSLADLASGMPAAFTRRLGAPRRTGGIINADLSLGDTWRRTSRMQFQYGVRVDGFHFADRPLFNPDVDKTFGIRTDRSPDAIGVSPRAGFSWNIGTAPKTANTMFGSGVFGTFAGGVGRFWQVLDSRYESAAIDNTGLPSGAQQVTCIGAAVPVAQWSAYPGHSGVIPTTCADGTAGTTFALATPRVTAFAPDFQPQSSWRANLRWNSYLGPKLRISLDATVSLNDHQSGVLDRNFNAAPRFTLTNEGGRPVFVSAAAIVPANGAVSLRDSRLAPSYAQVNVNTNDLRSRSTQLTISLTPVNGLVLCFSSGCAYPMQWNISYTTLRVDDQNRGFGGNTAGDPRTASWGLANGTIQHQINYNLSKRFGGGISVSVSGRFQSGTPYTPIVSGDVNGDGAYNDRAFIFNPNTTSDSTVAAGMRSMLANAPSGVRDCLRSQLDRIAERNSCHGPWTTTMNGQIDLRPTWEGWERVSFQLLLNNPLTGLDAMLHRGQLQGWGQPALSDPTLLYVRGFDPATNRFKYEVNQRFGDTRAFRNIPTAPFQVTLGVRVALAENGEVQNARMQLRQYKPKDKPPLDATAIKTRILGNYSSTLGQLLSQKDSLGLTKSQIDSLTKINIGILKQLDSLYAPMTPRFAKMQFDDVTPEFARELSILQRKATAISFDLLSQISAMLSTEQRKKLRSPLAFQLSPEFLQAYKGNLRSPIRPFYF